MTSLEDRQTMKRSMPQAFLDERHTENCRIVPTREALLDRLPKGGVVAEIGVAFGDFTREILNRVSPDRIYLMDMWSSQRYEKGLEEIKSAFAELIAEGKLVIDRGMSTERLEAYEDAYFDWVYIDTDHTYPTTRDELALSRAKVKPGGRILGHDFTSGNSVTPWPYGVIEACNEFCVRYGWEYEYLTLEPHGHFSFCLREMPEKRVPKTASGSFDQASYWIGRHEVLSNDPRSTGNLALSLEENQKREVQLIESVADLVGIMDGKVARVLDLGCGVGKIAGPFVEKGIDYTGLDVAPAALAKARETWPDARFVEIDLLEWTPDRTFDLVFILYVLVHFVREEEWERFFKAAADAVAPAGYLVIADQFPHATRGMAAHWVTRPFSDYVPLMEAAGLVVDDAMWDRVFAERPTAPHHEHFRFLRKAE